MAQLSHRFTLRDLPFVARLTLAVFLCSVGLGYLAALVQLHAQQAKPGQVLPGEKEVIENYHGKTGTSMIERLITTPETAPFTSAGSMRSAFTKRSPGWKAAISRLAADDKKSPAEAEATLRKARDDEAAILVSWLKEGKQDRKAYDDDKYPLPESMKDTTMTDQFIVKDDAGKKVAVNIKTLINTRCAKCHQEGKEAGFAPLDTYEGIEAYAETDSTKMPLTKLAQTTHVHLLGFSMLYMLTGLIFACSGWPAIIRFFIAPLALIAQIVDISFWWLARMQDPYGTEFAKCIMYSGGVAGAALALQIVLGLFSLFGWFGRFVVLLLLVGAAAGGYYLNLEVIAPYLAAQAKLAVP